MGVLRKTLKGLAYLTLGGIIIVVAYAMLMSGIFHNPQSYFEPAQYRPTDGSILVVGGAGGTGLEIVKQLRSRGETVVVTIRPTSNTEALISLGVETVVMDALIPEQVRDAVASQRYAAIVSTLGTSSRDLPKRQNTLQGILFGQTKMDANKRPDFIGNRNIVDAAVEFGIPRFILITVIGAGDSADALPLLARRGHNEVVPLKTQAEDHLRNSGLAYTIIRPGGLGPRNLKRTGTALLTMDAKAFSYMGRADLGEITIQALGDPATVGKTFTAYDPSRRFLWKLFID